MSRLRDWSRNCTSSSASRPVVERALRLALKAELAEELSSSTEDMKLARRRLARAEHERDKLVQAYLADALALPVLEREQQRVATEIALAQAEIQRMEECYRRS